MWNMRATVFGSPSLPPHFVKVWRISPTVRFLLSVSVSIRTADAAGAVALVRHFLVADAFFFAGAAADGPLDVVGRHVDLLGVGNDGAEPRIHVRVAAAVSGGDGQFLDDAREDLAALGVGRALLVLDGVPLGMA